jgi:hypothetical protein
MEIHKEYATRDDFNQLTISGVSSFRSVTSFRFDAIYPGSWSWMKKEVLQVVQVTNCFKRHIRHSILWPGGRLVQKGIVLLS